MARADLRSTSVPGFGVPVFGAPAFGVPSFGVPGLWAQRLGLAALAVLWLGILAGPASAQGGWWPWSGQQAPQQRPGPIPRDPVYRQPGQPAIPAPIPPQPQVGFGQKAPICIQLETRLVQEGQRGSTTRDQLPRIEAEMRQVERASQAAQAQLDRSDCYDYWLFSKTLRRTRQCVDLAAQADGSKRRLAELDAQRQQLKAAGGQSLLDDIYRELARNNCGADYVREAKRRNLDNPFASLWQDGDGPASGGGGFGARPGANTYRTVCVRLCDGYFFPVSFATLENHFDRDIDACESQCAAPAELYYYQNPGGSMEQAMSVRGRTPYAGLKTAFRFRKEFVQGCSCKQTEYTPVPAARVPERKTEIPTPRATAQQVPR